MYAVHGVFFFKGKHSRAGFLYCRSLVENGFLLFYFPCCKSNELCVRCVSGSLWKPFAHEETSS